MKKINFKQFEIFVDIDKTKSIVKDVHKDIANSIYTSYIGLDAHALAYKIYGSDGELELDDEECKLLMQFAESHDSPSLIDSLRNAMKEE